MLKLIQLKLEDPNEPFLGPNLKSLHFWGIILPKNAFKRKIYLCMHASLLLFASIVYVDIWFIRSDFDLLLKSIKYNLLTTINCVKIVTFVAWQGAWLEVIKYVSNADKKSRLKNNAVQNGIIQSYTRYCRVVTYSYWFLTCCTVLTVVLQPIAKYCFSPAYRESVRNGSELFDQVLSHKAPFNYDHVPEYIIALTYTTWATIYAGGLINSFDTIAICIMVFFKGELHLLENSCTMLFEGDKDMVFRNVRECQNRHAELVKYASVFNGCLSPIMFLYVLVTSFGLCASVYQITIETSTMQRLLTAEYAIFGVAQLLFYCWHGHDVIHASHSPMRGVYESGWWKHNHCRKEILLLTGQLDQRVYFTAGPFFNLTLGSFVNILKGAYSYYTLITQKTVKMSS